MLLSLIFFLPCVVSILWFVSFVLKQKNHRQRMFCNSEGASAIFYALMGMYFFPEIDYDTMVRMEAVCLPAGVLFPAFTISYMYSHCYGKDLSMKVQHLLYVPVIAYAVAVNQVIYIIGNDRAAEISRQFALNGSLPEELSTRADLMYHFLTLNGFIILLSAYVLVLLWMSCYCLYRHGYRPGDTLRFFFRRSASINSRIISVLAIAEIVLAEALLVIGTFYFTKHVRWGIIFMAAFATVKHLIAHIEFYTTDDKPVTLYDLSHLTLFTAEESEHDTDAPSAPVEQAAVTQTPAQVKMDKRYEEFRNLMEVKKIWKDEDLTALSVCDIMGIGKSTLSTLISQYYDSTFRDLINKYRIDEAKVFMAANPKETQETVALHCGFKNAQYFNTQFKKITGETPAIWLASNHS